MFSSVLVVDDDACFRQLAARVLAGSGYSVVGEAGSVEEAMARIEELQPDAALVDIGLPDGDGFSLAERLSALRDPIRVVLISTDAEAFSGLEAQRAGACGFLPKEELSGEAFRKLVEGA